MSKSSDQSKLKINRACDLNSITVLPPLSRRSNLMSQASQVRSQSQQSFSQGMAFSQSQLSQNSFDENLMIDQKFGSQEKDKSSKRILSLTSSGPTKDDSQLHLVRTSNNATRRWGTSSIPDNRFQVNEQIDNNIRQMEGSISRLGMILESVQNDVIQVNRIVKEVSVQMEGVCQKNLLHSTSDVVKEDRLKASLDASLKSISEKIVESNEKKINEIVTAISALPKQIESHLVKYHSQVCTIVTDKIEVLENDLKSLKSSHAIHIQSPKVIENDMKSSKSSHAIRIQSPKVIENDMKSLKSCYAIHIQSPKVIENDIKSSKSSHAILIQSPKVIENDMKSLKSCYAIHIQSPKVIENDMKSSKSSHAIRIQSPKVIENDLQSLKSSYAIHIQSPKVLENDMKSLKTSHAIRIQSPKTNYCSAARRSPGNKMPTTMLPQFCQTTRYSVSKRQAIYPKYSQPKPTALHHYAARTEEVPNSPKGPQVKDFRIFIDTDEESDACLPCIHVKKETRESDYLIEAEEETRRILRKARLRRKRRNSCVILD